ncbi:MAG: hypothetical protein EOM26_00435 [Alphaproteobacteria bacterium]|nr:hypothetical protein [Alphaproteobacteria bacterium]
MRLRNGGAHVVNVTDVSARNSVAFDAGTKVVSLYATGPVFLRFGDAAVTASGGDHYFPDGVYYDVAIGGGKTKSATHVAAIRVGGDCQLFISEKE